MIEKYSIRTDLALEQKERFESDNVEVPGVVLDESYDDEKEIRTTTVKIETENGAKTMGKPVGTYITMEAPNMTVPDEGYHEEISEELLKHLKQFARLEKKDYSVLVVGLGNRKVTPDALGSYVVDNLNITRHIVKEYGKYAMGEDQARLVSAIVPGVMGQTGMETVEILKGVVEETKPDLLIAIDALAARSSRRLNSTIQIADTGINPGSGVGNHRHSLTKESLGVPVLAIGVPTVVGAAAIVHDTVNTMIETLANNMATKGMGDFIQEMSPDEQYDLIRELLEPEFGSLYVTPPNIDEMIGRLSFTISEGIHQAVFE